MKTDMKADVTAKFLAMPGYTGGDLELWCYSYDESTRFVSAKHPRGGEYSIAEIVGGNDLAAHVVGHALAVFFTKGLHNLILTGKGMI